MFYVCIFVSNIWISAGRVIRIWQVMIDPDQFLTFAYAEPIKFFPTDSSVDVNKG